MADKNHLKRHQPTKWQVASGKWQVASGKWQVASGKWQVASGKWQVANTSSQPIQATTQCPSLKHAPYRTTHHTSTNHTAHTPASTTR
ncbi:hypothetical protein ADT29_04315 [Xylella fastidiosa]|nr:hypothetical protein ADT29_04315 [Xylella fastidiosa]